MISIVIPNYNGEKFLKDCLQSISIQSFKNFDVIIVDNASTDNSIDIIEKYKSILDICLIRNSENLGFAKAVNIGIKHSIKEYVFLLNNDVILKPNTLEEIYNSIRRDEKIFSVQSKMIQYYNNEKIDDAGDEYTILGWAYQTGNNRSSKLYIQSREIFSSCAGAAIYRKDILEKIGLFDENFFAYMEDVDIGYRARIYGYRNVYCPDAVCYHIGSATTGSKYNKFKIRLAARNNIYVPYKNMPLLQLIFNFPFLFIGFVIKWIFFSIKGYGKVYLNGIFEGLKTIHKIRRVKYKKGYTLNYFKIQWLLIKNTFKYIFEKIM
ncbi:glycosyl transferase family 2 [Caloranaerobacter azorensis H53214]|uniref:Glycosyl transferase family 2 n=1 Tax=Caloranaerobacter azorensis H53214 TaxID=1156417 RepID=A0A096BGD5_9FIRM|nr:glycosyltransferase family 2 protein [Caloranaerobacter azorensis]KGG79808.1 glycosyl transferase family 2 [Caloranaerobacter azorensis H53214]